MVAPRQLQLLVEAEHEWPDRLLEGTDIAYNTEVLERGLAAHASAQELLVLKTQFEELQRTHDLALENVRKDATARVEAAEATRTRDLDKTAHDMAAIQIQLQEQSAAHETAMARVRQDSAALIEAAEAARVREAAGAQELREDLQKLHEAIAAAEQARDAFQQQAAEAYERGMKDAAAAPICVGKEGELFVEEELRRLFPTGTVQDVSGIRGATDRILHLEAGCSIHVEIKNTELLHPKQVSDFKANVSKSQAAAALFVFLRETPIVNHGHFEVETDPTPTVFLYGVRRNPDLLKSAVQFLVNAVEVQRRLGDTDTLPAIQARVRAIMDGPVQQSIRSMRQSISTLANQQHRLEMVVLGDIAEAIHIKPQIQPKPPKPAVKKRTCNDIGPRRNVKKNK